MCSVAKVGNINVFQDGFPVHSQWVENLPEGNFLHTYIFSLTKLGSATFFIKI